MKIQTRTPLWKEGIYRLYSLTRRVIGSELPSTQSGMGAIPYDAGTTFRVWAPHANRVLVSGTFNQWSKERHPLTPEGNGYWSADISQARAGDEYKYLIHNGKQRLLRSDPYAREVSHTNSNSIIYTTTAENSAEIPPWMPKWNEMVIYELHVGTFGQLNGNSNGNFQGVINKLPYLKNLGINAIEIMPVAEFGGDYSWGYNTAHPFAITQTYGGPLAFRELVRAAHEQGIAVIMDVVYNHFGPEDLSLWQFDGWSENGKGGIYFYNDWRSTTPWADTRPDYGRPEVRQFIRDNCLMWLEEYQLDGLRWDATAWIRNVYGHEGDEPNNITDGWDLLRWVNDEINSRKPWAITIAEDLRNNTWLTKPTQEGGAGFDTQWDDSFVHPIRQALIAKDDADRDVTAVAAAIEGNSIGDVFNRVIFTESHDEVANGKARVPEEIAPGEANALTAQKRASLGAALVFTSPGIPMIFQGQEFLEDGWFDDKDPLDWEKTEKNAGMIRLFQSLISLRRNIAGKSRGLTGQGIKILQVEEEQKIIVFHRWEFGGPGDDVLVVANFSNQIVEEFPISLPKEGTWQLLFNSDRQIFGEAYLGIEPDPILVDETINIGPFAVLIYALV